MGPRLVLRDKLPTASAHVGSDADGGGERTKRRLGLHASGSRPGEVIEPPKWLALRRRVRDPARGPR